MTRFFKYPSAVSHLIPCILLLTLAGSLSGCATLAEWFGFDDSSTVQQSAESLAIEGMENFNVGSYHSALEKFEEILDRFPFSPEAMLAELKAADSHYYQDHFLEAKILYQQFEERHPTNEAIPYVMFQIGMCDFSRTDRIDRDTSGAKDAIQSFSRLLRAYPDSPYTYEAKARISAAQEFLVNHEFFVAVFYLRTDRIDESAHRLKYLLAMYPESSIAPKAKNLLERIEAGDAPRIGLSRWLPSLSMPDWNLFKTDKKEKPEK
jgi:outer membrane protein assembly factor BamD